MADASLGMGQVADASLGMGQVADANLGTGQVADASLGMGQVADASLGMGQVADANLGTGQVADASLGMGQVDDANLGMAANTRSYWPLMHAIRKRVQVTTLGEFLSVTLSTSKEYRVTTYVPNSMENDITTLIPQIIADYRCTAQTSSGGINQYMCHVSRLVSLGGNGLGTRLNFDWVN